MFQAKCVKVKWFGHGVKNYEINPVVKNFKYNLLSGPKGKSEQKGNKQVKTKNLKLENAKNIVRMTKRLCDHLYYS